MSDEKLLDLFECPHGCVNCSTCRNSKAARYLADAIQVRDQRWQMAKDAKAEAADLRARLATLTAERPYDKAYVAELHRQIEEMRPLVHELAQAKADLERVTRERDEARREAQEADEHARSLDAGRNAVLASEAAARAEAERLLEKLLKFTEYVCNIANEMDIVQPEDEAAEDGVLAAARAWLSRRKARTP